MVGFLIAAAALVAVTLLLLLRPWRRAAAASAAVDARELATRLYRDQLAELDRDLAAGTLRAEDHAQACAELQRRLLEDAEGLPARTDGPAAGRTAWLLAAALPLLAAAMYAWLGTPAALAPPARPAPPAASAQADRVQVEKMLSELAARAEKNPGNTRDWATLARAYRLLGRLNESGHAFERMGTEVEQSPALLVEYADVLGALAGGNLEGRPLQLVKRALELDPGHVPALSLYATAASRRQDMALAITTWERALALAPPDSEDAKWLAQVLAEARGAGAPAAASAASPPGATERTAITGRVSLAPALAAQVRPGDTLFVYARPVDGRMPLAVLRTQAGALPLAFTLDDSLAMSPAAKLSGATRVRVEARISRSGQAAPSAGDLVAAGEVVATGTQGLTLLIDRVQP